MKQEKQKWPINEKKRERQREEGEKKWTEIGEIETAKLEIDKHRVKTKEQKQYNLNVRRNYYRRKKSGNKNK